MEDKIEVGESIRTRRGEICKILGISPEVRDEKRLYSHKAYWLDNRKGSLTEPYIMKHSKDIIDLIEVGDVIAYFSNSLGIYIKCEVNYVCSKQEDYKRGIGYVSTVLDDLIRIEDIKSIVTKEQFTSMEYKI